MKLLFFLCMCFSLAAHDKSPISFTVQKRINKGNNTYEMVNEKQLWNPQKTAIIICDMWDHHWCKGAERRVAELAPHMNNVLKIAREKGIMIVHSPSDCMKYYATYPQRITALKYALKGDRDNYGTGRLPSEKDAVWPVDQSNEGCNDTPRCAISSPWSKQIDLLEIADNDIISDSGNEIYRLFKARGIDHVILMGVHTNMCVVERPFGLRNMVNYGMKVALMRDLTDLMYDSRQAPYVDHFEGLGLMVEYIEKYIAPSVTSTDLTGEPAFRFAEDPRR